nr:uncharacterized protein LOC125966903 [Syngnathus scovelli]XP_049573441.1 uncharacterized protein LOC125966903 [Syngnathus scovelli]
MGNGKSKNNIRDNLKCKDWKIIERQDPDQLKKLDKWVKKYKFEGQLKTTKLIELRGAMKEKTKRDPRKMKKEGDEDVVFWLKVAGERERGEKEKVEKALYCRKEDDETGPNGRQARDNQNLQRAREEGGGVEEVEKHVGKAHATTSKHKVIEKLYPQIPDTGAQEGSTPPYGLTDRATRPKIPIEMDWSKEMRANYTEIGRTKQNDNETFDEYRVRMKEVFKLHSGLVEDNAPQGAYQQQLKNAIHVRSRPAIQGWVIKHYIGMNTGTLEEYIKRLRSFNICNKLLEMFYQSVVASVLFYTVVCWGSSTSKKDTSRLDKLVRRAGSLIGKKLDSLETVAEARTLKKLLDIIGNVSHPLHSVITNQRSRISGRLLLPNCRTSRLKNSFVPQAIKLFNSSLGRR